jgi:hypothetical protein
MIWPEVLEVNLTNMGISVKWQGMRAIVAAVAQYNKGRLRRGRRRLAVFSLGGCAKGGIDDHGT